MAGEPKDVAKQTHLSFAPVTATILVFNNNVRTIDHNQVVRGRQVARLQGWGERS